MLIQKSLLALCLLALSLPALATTRIIVLGGGAGPDSSEISIEKNVGWIVDMLRRNGRTDFDVQFAGGSLSNADVKEKNPDVAGRDKWLPLARVFSSKSSLLTAYRKNTVANREQENTRDNVIELLEQRLQQSQPGDDVLIIYRGHGGHEPSDTDRNYLRLWGETQLSVIELIEVLDKQPDDVTLRFIFPQCFSGSFVKLIHNNANDQSLDSVNIKRCGFVTVPDDRQSEGCTVEDDETQYRDFSTYFFAAITGKSRLGQPLKWSPDKNDDGVVDFREAYFYANMEAYARGVPRATSEYFLELWQPWYVRWLPFDIATIDNEYKDVAAHLAHKLGIKYASGEDGFTEAMHASRKQAESVFRDTNKALAQLKQAEKKIRAHLKTQISMQWPDATNAYTDSYFVFVERDLAELNRWLLAQAEYTELAELQEKIEQLEASSLSADRDIGMNMRLQRALQLAKLRDAIDRFGSQSELEKYNALLQCEAWDGFIK